MTKKKSESSVKREKAERQQIAEMVQKVRFEKPDEWSGKHREVSEDYADEVV